ncbi:hypothetical protein ABIF32_006851 [Bradyrhizobium elkanii]
MQRAGEQRAAAERERGGGEIRHTDRPQQQAKQADRRPDGGPDQGKQPLRPGKPLRPRAVRMRHRQAGQEGGRGPEIVEPLIHGEGLEIGLKRDGIGLDLIALWLPVRA